jgi:hypothetical protein
MNVMNVMNVWRLQRLVALAQEGLCPVRASPKKTKAGLSEKTRLAFDSNKR